MYYGYTILATYFDKKNMNDKKIKILNTLFFFLKANPDHEKFYPQTKKWFLELDESGQPIREIGMNQNGDPLFTAPDKRNTGFWTDNNKTFQKNELKLSNKEIFEAMWNTINK